MTTNNALNVGLSGATGTGEFVGSTSATIVTPTVQVPVIVDSNSNDLLTFTTTASAVNYFNIKDNASGSSPVITATGSDTNVIGTLSAKGTGGWAIKGTGTNNSASAGYVGEVVSSVISSGSAISFASGTATDVTSITLSAGDWDVFGNVYFIDNLTYFAYLYAWSSLSSATFPDESLVTEISGNPTVGSCSICIPTIPYSFSTTTTVYMTGKVSYSGGSAQGCGGLYARRRR